MSNPNPNSFSLSAYKNVLGEPRKDLRTIRLFDISVVDTLATLGLAVFISKQLNVGFSKSLIGCLVVGELAHVAFGVDTKVIQKGRVVLDNIDPVSE
jgi:hypothetical protein